MENPLIASVATGETERKKKDERRNKGYKKGKYRNQ
jgi:hypothetical protein